MRAAVIQQTIIPGEVEANYRKVEELVTEAADRIEPDLIVLPELWSTGYALKELKDLASDKGQREAEFLGGLAQRHGLWFAGGSVAAKTSKGISNRAQIVNPQGELVAWYDKAHLVPMLDEHRYLVAGDQSLVCQIGGIKIGFAICYDIRFCEFIRKLALDGAQVIVVAAQWPLVRLRHWQALLSARAIENQCYILAANNAAFGRAPFAGHSQILAPDGRIVTSLEFQEGIIHSLLELDEVTKIREAVPVFADRRPELY